MGCGERAVRLCMEFINVVGIRAKRVVLRLDAGTSDLRGHA